MPFLSSIRQGCRRYYTAILITPTALQLLTSKQLGVYTGDIVMVVGLATGRCILQRTKEIR